MNILYDVKRTAALQRSQLLAETLLEELATDRRLESRGIKQAGFWTTVIGESSQTLYYFVAWESLAEREKKWAAFGSDPAWLTARAKTEENGPIVANVKNFILAPTAFSAVK